MGGGFVERHMHGPEAMAVLNPLSVVCGLVSVKLEYVTSQRRIVTDFVCKKSHRVHSHGGYISCAWAHPLRIGNCATDAVHTHASRILTAVVVDKCDRRTRILYPEL